MQELNELEKKLKLHQREVLLPLYQEHAFYLTRVVKTLVEKDDNFNLDLFIKSISSWQLVATCHEVAINESSSLQLETHQNKLGKERDYTNHEKAKNVGRDDRVRIIWGYLYNNLINTELFDSVKIYNDLANIPHVYCPVCDKILFKAQKMVLGRHRDGTENFVWEYEDYYEDHYAHMIMEDQVTYNDYYELINTLDKDFGITWERILDYEKILTDYDLDPNTRNTDADLSYFCDWDDFERIIHDYWFFDLLLEEY